MGSCSVCYTVLLCPSEVAPRLKCTPCRVRAILQHNPGRLQAFKLDELHWVIPETALAEFKGSRGQRGQAVQPAGPTGICPGCGTQLYTVAQAAQRRRRGIRAIYSIIRRNPGRLQEFQIGDLLVVTGPALDAYQDRRSVQRVRRRVRARIPVCNCGRYKFPHRRSGGRCGEDDHVIITVSAAGDITLTWPTGMEDATTDGPDHIVMLRQPRETSVAENSPEQITYGAPNAPSSTV